MKVAILGYSGSGKSTLAKYISIKYGIPLLYLDTVQFEAGWKERDREEAVSMVADFMHRNKDWVIDGNYTGFLQNERLEQADYIIYMEFSRWNCLLRVYRRFRRNKNISRESMASGCNEKMDLDFIWWILYKGRNSKKISYYNNIVTQYCKKTIVIKSQKELDRFMVELFDSKSFTK